MPEYSTQLTYTGSSVPTAAQTAVNGRMTVGGLIPIGSGASGWITFVTKFTGPAEAVYVTPANVGPGTAFFPPSIGPAGSFGAGSAWVQVSGVQVGSIYYLAIGPGPA